MNCSPFILVGHDYEGETREIGCAAIEQARKIAGQVMENNGDGMAWQDYAIWGNHPVTENWEALETSDTNFVPSSGKNRDSQEAKT